jgi:hypothetical protein
MTYHEGLWDSLGLWATFAWLARQEEENEAAILHGLLSWFREGGQANV